MLQMFISAILLISSQISFSNSIHIIASHPRSVSTAFLRIFQQRQDVLTLNEIFTRVHYVAKLGLEHEETKDWHRDLPYECTTLKAWLIDQQKFKDLVIKDMAFGIAHCLSQDPQYFVGMNATFIFLIRHPNEALPSLLKIEPDADAELAGYSSLERLYEYVEKNQIPHKLVLSASLLADPENTYEQACRFFNLSFSADHLVFKTAVLEEWKGINFRWYKTVVESKTIYRHSTAGDQRLRDKPMLDLPELQTQFNLLYPESLRVFEKLQQVSVGN